MTSTGGTRTRRAGGDLLAAILLLGPVLAAGGCAGPDAAPATEVVVYCSVDQQIAEPILQAFERSRGIRVRARFDTEASKTVGLVQRLRSRADHPEADVFWSGEVFHTIRLAREGLLQPYAWEGAAAWPAAMKDPQGRWYGFAMRMRVVAYHTGRVPEAEAPSRLEDLLEARWRGRMVMAAPEFGTTCGHVASWFVHYGPERAQQILEGLKANGVRLVDGNSTAVRMVATGQADVCLTDTDDVYAAQRNGWPVAMRMLGHGDGGPLAIPNTVAVVRGAPHPEAARALAAFLLSEETERALARSDAHHTPVHETVAREFPAYAAPPCLLVDYDEVAAMIPTAIEAAGKTLR